jgi:manganese-dependent inorganic pyrophosphatase
MPKLRTGALRCWIAVALVAAPAVAAPPVLVVGHRNPDTDAIVAALAMAALLRQQGTHALAVAQGPPNPETDYVLRRCGLAMPPIQTSITDQAVMLVDHSDAALAPDGLKPANLVGIVDHHKLGGLESDAPLVVRIEPVGSTATLITELFLSDHQRIERPLACGLLGAVLSDTRSLTSPTTTAKDRKAMNVLASRAQIANPIGFGNAMLQAYATAMAQRDDSTLINTDFKRFQMGRVAVGISQVEAPDITFVLRRRQSLLQAMEQQRAQQGLHTLLLMATDVPRQGSEILVVSAEPERIAALFGASLQQQSAWVPGLMSRKRQVVPVLQQSLR